MSAASNVPPSQPNHALLPPRRNGKSVVNVATADEPSPDGIDTVKLAAALVDRLSYATLTPRPDVDKPDIRSTAIENVRCCALLLVHADDAYSARLTCSELELGSTRNDKTADGYIQPAAVTTPLAASCSWLAGSMALEPDADACAAKAHAVFAASASDD